MADVNRRPNEIIRRVVDSGESAIILKHGKPIAEIRPLPGTRERDRAIEFLSSLEPIAVGTPLEEVIEKGRIRGL